MGYVPSVRWGRGSLRQFFLTDTENKPQNPGQEPGAFYHHDLQSCHLPFRLSVRPSYFRPALNPRRIKKKADRTTTSRRENTRDSSTPAPKQTQARGIQQGPERRHRFILHPPFPRPGMGLPSKAVSFHYTPGKRKGALAEVIPIPMKLILLINRLKVWKSRNGDGEFGGKFAQNETNPPKKRNCLGGKREKIGGKLG